LCFRCAFGVALHGARADRLRFGHLARSLRRAGTRAGLSPERGGPGHSKARAHRRERGGAPPTRGRGRSEDRGLIIRDEAGLEGGRAVDGQNPRSRSSLRGTPGGATNRASHPRLLKTVNISPQNRHNLRKHKRAHEQASSSCAEIDSVPPRSVDLDRAMRSLPERPVRR